MKTNPEKRDIKEKYILPYHWMIEPFSSLEAHYTTYSKQLIELLPPPPLKVLDIGCGDGKIADILIKKGYSVTGIDISDNAIAFSKILVPEATFYVIDITDPQILKNSGLSKQNFDIIILNAVLEHIHPDKRNQILNSIYHFLKDMGVFILSVPTPRLRQSEYHYNHFEMQEIQQLLKTNDFNIDKVIYSHDMKHISSILIFSSFSKLIVNRWYDLKLIRQAVVKNFEKNAAKAGSNKQAGMLVIRSRKNNVYVT